MSMNVQWRDLCVIALSGIQMPVIPPSTYSGYISAFGVLIKVNETTKLNPKP
jgi:hypothetical protein